MQCPSCGAISARHDCCGEFVLDTVTEQERSDCAAAQVSNATVNQSLHLSSAAGVTMNSATELANSTDVRKSTLIEFPGVNRTPLPQWRKELSERVREVQERRAREAREAIELEQSQNPAESNLQHQLELLPAVEAPPMNPLVAAALRRIERAHQPAPIETGQSVNMLATAVAYAPECEENDLEVPAAQVLEVESENPVETILETEHLPIIEKNHNLTVVPSVDEALEIHASEPKSVARRLIMDDPNDPALNYLDSISRTIRVEETGTRRASAFRRLVCAFLDLIICALLCAPIALAMKLTGTSVKDPRAIQVLVGCFVVATFIYLTLTTALTGRTLAMRLLDLRIIDTKTGLIPTGGQSVGRSFLYLGSIALAGIGIIGALVSREGYAVHDRLSRTAVIRL